MTSETGNDDRFTPADRSLLDPDARLHALGFALPTDPPDPIPRERICCVCHRVVPPTRGTWVQGRSDLLLFAHAELDHAQPNGLAADCCAAVLYALGDADRLSTWTILRRLYELKGLHWDLI